MGGFEIKYYPLVDCDTEGTEKVAMFMSTDGETIEKIHEMYLSEIVPNYYRLHCKDTKSKRSEDTIIRCPNCGEKLFQIGGAMNKKKLGLYTCKKCQ